ALQAVEFWSTICDVEIDMLDKNEDAADHGLPPPENCQKFIKGVVGHLIPVLIPTLTKQEEYEEDDTWNIAMAGGTCLALIANTVLDDVVPHVMPFVTQN